MYLVLLKKETQILFETHPFLFEIAAFLQAAFPLGQEKVQIDSGHPMK